MSVKASVSISESQDAYARALVADGRYSSLSAVIQHGLELLRAETEAREADTKALRALLEERAKGPFLSAEDFGKKIDAMLANKRRVLGL